MLKQVQLHGSLANRFTADPITLNADNVSAVFRGLNSAFPSFRSELTHHDVGIVVERAGVFKALDKQDLIWNLHPDDKVHVASGVKGSGAEAAAAFASWVASYGTAAYAVAYAVAYVAISVAISYVAGKIIQSMSDVPDASGNNEVDARRSGLFNGPVNVVQQGSAIPLVYGRFRVGSIVVSSEVTPERLAITMNDTANIESGMTATGNVFSNDVEGATLTLTNFVIDGVTKAPGTTHTTSDYSVTIDADGDYTVTTDGAFEGTITAVYTASSDTTAAATATLSVIVYTPVIWEAPGGY